MKKSIIAILAVILVMAAVAALGFGAMAEELPFENLFKDGFAGYTSHEKEVLTQDFLSSQPIPVSAGDDIWFGPCNRGQYFHLVGQDAAGNAVTGKVRGKELTITEEFNNGMVIYKYTVPAGVSQLVFSAPTDMVEVYTAAKTEITELTWRAYWSSNGKNPNDFVGQSSYYEVSQGDKLYFGAITKADALNSKVYSSNGSLIGTIAESDLRQVENFGGAYNLYCYTIPADAAYVYVTYDTAYEQYFVCKQVAKSETVTDEAFIAEYIRTIGVPQPLPSTVAALQGKTALFLGDSITYGARDRANIYGAGSWAGRIGYYAGMNVTNNGVSGACISTARRESSSEAHYIYNNLKKTEGTQYDYVIMHGLFNDASEGVPVGTMQGKANFDPAKADISTYAGGLETLFYQARVQNPNAILGFIVNFKTDRAVDQAPYVNMAIAICEAWGVEYLDLYNLEGFKVEFDDGLHPSSAGYDSMYTVVANWMATLQGGTETAVAEANVMSYNVYFGAQDADCPIENRFQKVANVIKAQSPDIAVLQEFTDEFEPFYNSTLAGTYSIHGEADGENHTSASSEAAVIIWKTGKYDVVETGTFWASETPDVPYSESWCQKGEGVKTYPRAINWVVLKDKETSKELLVMSVHGQPDMSAAMDNTTARTKTMELVAAKASQISAAHNNCGIVVGGDMNTAVGSAPYNALVNGGLTDIRALVNPGAPGSYNDWTRETSKFAMGDYLFANGDVNAVTYQVITNDLDTGRTDGKTVHVSDHCPIVMKIYF